MRVTAGDIGSVEAPSMPQLNAQAPFIHPFFLCWQWGNANLFTAKFVPVVEQNKIAAAAAAQRKK